MLRSSLLLILLLLPLGAVENVWTQETKGLSPQKRDAIIQAYREGNESTLKFEDDVKPRVISEIEENILVVGASVGYGSTTETVSNTVGAYDVAYTVGSFKLLLGKDFTLWHEEYTQPVRLYLQFTYAALSTDVRVTTFTFGIKENMRYWPLYKNDSFSIYPSLSYEIGSSSLQRASYDISGITSEFAGGLSYQRGDFEYALNLVYNQTAWEHPIEGIKDESQGFQAHLNLNYRWMYDE